MVWASTRSGSPRLAQIRAASASAAYPPREANWSSSAPYRRTSLSSGETASCASTSAIWAISTSSPRAESTRSRAVTSRSPVRGSWGR